MSWEVKLRHRGNSAQCHINWELSLSTFLFASNASKVSEDKNDLFSEASVVGRDQVSRLPFFGCYRCPPNYPPESHWATEYNLNIGFDPTSRRNPDRKLEVRKSQRRNISLVCEIRHLSNAPHGSRKRSEQRVLSNILCSKTWHTSWKTSDLYLSNKKKM